jgi:hypothetical protein
MKNKMVNFDPAQYSEAFARQGYVHIPQGVTEEYYTRLESHVNENFRSHMMKEFAIGDKQQSKYEFPDDGDYVQEFFDAVGKVCGFKPGELVLSERHIKHYESDAVPNPHAHKDRFASQISVGISVHVQEGSTLVLYPHEMREVNPFNSSTRLRASLSREEYPEPVLKNMRSVEIQDSPRDVIIFHGNNTWHLRKNAALTTMLYLKLNAFNCDPLGEDPFTEEYRKHTQKAIDMHDRQLEQLVPLLGRRVDYIHRYYNRDWNEVLGVVLWNENHFTIDEQEFALLKAVDGKHELKTILQGLNSDGDKGILLQKVRRLADRGVIDLVNQEQDHSSAVEVFDERAISA